MCFAEGESVIHNGHLGCSVNSSGCFICSLSQKLLSGGEMIGTTVVGFFISELKSDLFDLELNFRGHFNDNFRH